MLVKGLIQISDLEFNEMMEERKPVSPNKLLIRLKNEQINILFLLLLLPLFSIGQQTLSLEECYALSIKLSYSQTN
jgi:hypothetical protein